MSKIFGIVNITTDSFSDGGLYLDTDKAIEHALHLVEDGADVIDLGAASSNPDTTEVGVVEEIKRLKPVIKALKEKGMSISVDTFKPEVQSFCIEQKVDFINDIQGFPYPEIYSGLAKSDCKLVLMHSVQRIGAATKVETNPEEVFTSMMEFFKERIAALVEAGVKRERIILDPGMGFFLGSNPETSILVLKRFPEIQEAFNLQVMIAVSRKSFLGKITGTDVKSRLAPTLAAEMYAYKKGADYLRTHDVKSLSDALKISKALG
ncbi:sulfonamide-resistant dihydropteroate synthase Sul3 [Salmonella enterica]|nr:sulfonamide-resistant dihydropteroate synthase Sul3 [Salmonella enterica]